MGKDKKEVHERDMNFLRDWVISGFCTFQVKVIALLLQSQTKV